MGVKPGQCSNSGAIQNRLSQSWQQRQAAVARVVELADTPDLGIENRHFHTIAFPCFENALHH